MTKYEIKEALQILVTGIISLILGALMIYGYFANILKLANIPSPYPYTSHTIRIIGVILPPLGAITGHLTFDTEKQYIELKEKDDE